MLILGPVVLLTIANIILLTGMSKCAKGRKEDTALLDWADKDGHHSARYKSIRQELRAFKALDERTKS